MPAIAPLEARLGALETQVTRIEGQLGSAQADTARARGLHTCPQAAWNGFSKIILPYIGARENEMLVCGMSLGYADESPLVNTFQTTRVAAESFTHWLE